MADDSELVWSAAASGYAAAAAAISIRRLADAGLLQQDDVTLLHGMLQELEEQARTADQQAVAGFLRRSLPTER